MLGFLTGGDRLVVRGGYARTHDYAFLNIALNVASSFPQVATVTYRGARSERLHAAARPTAFAA